MFFRDRKGDDTKFIFAVLPLREVVVFPHTPMSLIVGRPRSVAAVNAANREKREILLLTQKNAEHMEPSADDLYGFGTLATIEQTLRLPDGNTKVLVEGRRRARVVRLVDQGDHFQAEIEEIPAAGAPSVELQALMRTVKGAFERYVKVNRQVPAEMLLAVNAMEDPGRLADALVAPLQFKLVERQEILELADPSARLERVYKSLLTEIEFLQVERKLKTRVKRERENGEREQWLADQMKQIQREIGDKEGRGELEELAQAIANKDLPDPIRDRAQKELRKLSQMNLMSAEATVVRNYLDWILALPWSERADTRPTLDEASAILDEDHFGLERIKERVLDYIAVASLVEKLRGPILCLVGPPGVGKTSLARSIARATGRPFTRIALGGVRDEAEIRGHRRTYIGAMPGKLLHAMKRAGRVDPVVLLDEVDKMSADFRGDPAAALLEVLDPEQNTAFNDHYMDLDYDLSEVLFICTANTLQGIPVALQDRLEIVELSGYTEPEKLGIARRYLLPKQRELHGLKPDALAVDDAALLEVVRRYTKESGVRELERQIARICRKTARQVVAATATPAPLQPNAVEPLLGPPKFDISARESEDLVGLVKGLAVSPWGGELLNVEVAAVPGKGNLILTGRLGDWLKESATAAFTYVRSRADALHLDPDFHTKDDFHVHYPGNPLRTDGPSAGITMAVALVSTLTGVPVRADTAMTGEISLRGRVLPIGGVKEKVLAAHRGGITRVILPEANRKDLDDVPPAVREAMEFLFVTHMDRVLLEALAAPHGRLPTTDYQETEVTGDPNTNPRPS
jgi:ATP-dependent Lon protease